MKTFNQLVAECQETVTELMPWDLEEKIQGTEHPVLLDIREPYEYCHMHIYGSLNVPRGILETACEYDYEETVPELVEARDKEIIIICRSGNRSILAAAVMQEMGYQNVASLKTGLRGWNDYEQPMVNQHNETVDIDEAERYFTPHLRPEQETPKK
jgi:rhodanese-related sulfurtransferase